MNSGDNDLTVKTIYCPQCRKQTTWEGNAHRPFCSERCRAIDLGQWADEEYRIPVATLDNVVPFPVADDDKE